MFVRVKKTKNSPKPAVQIVQSKRVDGKVRQTIVRHIGVARDDAHLNDLKFLARRFIVDWEVKGQSGLFSSVEQEEQVEQALMDSNERTPPPGGLPVDLLHIREQDRVIRGIHEVYGQLYEQLGLSKLLPPSRYRASNRVLREIVMARLAQPSSKRASVKLLAEKMGTRIQVTQVYRMMDHLNSARIEKLNRLASDRATELLEPPVDVFFFDCTTLYFESFISDELKAPGYSKDAKFKESQVLLAVMVTAEGLPVRYRVLPGRTFEGHSLKGVVDEFRSHMPLRRAVVVADRGMLSHANLQTLRAADIDYIVGERLRACPKRIVDVVLDPHSYELVPWGRIADIDVDKTDRMVVQYSPHRAEKDRKERAVKIQKLRQRCEKHPHPKAFLSNRGYAKYLRISGATHVELNEDKIQEDAQWDGLHGVRTSLRELPAPDVLNAYRGLWQVERTFRIAKHDLRIRPVFHWTPERIQAHIAIAFMALLCIRHLEHRCSLLYQPLSPEAIQNSLTQMQHSVLEDTSSGRRYIVPSRISTHAKGLYRLVGKRPSEVPFELTKPT